MARFFKYKTTDDLARDAARLGLDLRLAADPSALLRPLAIGDRRVGNRLVVQPMEGCDGTSDGAPGELTLRRYRRFGDGGAKLVWGEAAAVVPDARANPRQLVADPRHEAGLAGLVAACRASHRAAWGDDSDLLIGLQITHSGRYSFARPILATHDPRLDPRTVIDKASGAVAVASTPLLSDDDLERLQDRYVEAAALAARVGFDFVDIKQCHRYLLNELLGAHDRPGRYGGPFENRSRFVLELVGRIRDRVPGLLIATRLNVYDGPPYRLAPDGRGESVAGDPAASPVWGAAVDDPLRPDFAEPLELVARLRAAGVELVNVSLGNPYASPHLVRPYEYPPPDGYETPEHPLVGVARHLAAASAVQRAFPDLAVVGSGYSWLQALLFDVGAAAVEDGRVSLVGVGRASLSQPDFARRLIEGRPLDPKKTCRTFSYCTALMRSKHNELGQFASGCPPFDKEVYGPIWKDAQGPAP